MDEIEKLQEIIDNSSKIVFFGGAGVSTESGIPDFRGKDGLYNSVYSNINPEEILSHHFFYENPEVFYKFYREKILLEGTDIEVKPNIAHLKLAEMESKGKLTAIVTQNIDLLHEMAGSKKVYHLHGSISSYQCENGHHCGLDYVSSVKGIAKCGKCGCILKPDVVLYEEPLPEDVWSGSFEAISSADTLIVAGTSLTVYPASMLVKYFRGKNLVIINYSTTDYDNQADLVIHDSLGKVLSQIQIK